MYFRTLSCSPGIGVEPQQAEKTPVPLVAEQEFFGVCGYKGIACENYPEFKM